MLVNRMGVGGSAAISVVRSEWEARISDARDGGRGSRDSRKEGRDEEWGVGFMIEYCRPISQREIVG